MGAMNSRVRKRIMVVEDNSLNREMLRMILADSYDIVEAENGQEAINILKSGSIRIDLILLDVVMPVMDGFTFLERLRNDEILKLIPVIVATQSDGDDNEIKALRCGATDFFSKPYKPEIIRHRIENIFRLRENATIASQFQYDSMTDLYSRGYFFMKVAEWLEANPDVDYNIVCVNIVNFKLYNEVFGEKKGNELLIGMAETIRKYAGDGGVCGRFGGDRFVILQEREREETDRANFVSTGRGSIEGVMVKFGVYEIVDRTIGIDVMCDRGFMAADSIRNRYDVNVALYDAAMRTRIIREKTITESMESAVTKDQFEIYYQPKYDVDSVQIAGAEALIRWNHPELGYVPPNEFITLFEKNGFITILDKYVINKVCMQMGEWKAEGLKLPPVSVNLSRTDVYCSDIVEYITGCIETNGLAASDIHIEITESAYTEHPAQIIAMVEKMRDNGIVIELDDFGTGYSSLNMLNEINADVLKMDMRFIRTKSEKEAQQGILKLIINLARWMDMKVIAEGVETEEQLMRIRDVGCDYVQGYLFSRPLPSDEYEKLIRNSDVICRTEIESLMPTVLVADSDDEYVKAVSETFAKEFNVISSVNCRETIELLDDSVSALILGTELPGDMEELENALKIQRRHKKLPIISVFKPGIVTDEMAESSPGDDFLCRCHPISNLKQRIINMISTE